MSKVFRQTDGNYPMTYQSGYYQIFKGGMDLNKMVKESGGYAVTRVEVSLKFLHPQNDDRLKVLTYVKKKNNNRKLIISGGGGGRRGWNPETLCRLSTYHNIYNSSKGYGGTY